jgi:hypothetical protein
VVTASLTAFHGIKPKLHDEECQALEYRFLAGDFQLGFTEKCLKEVGEKF